MHHKDLTSLQSSNIDIKYIDEQIQDCPDIIRRKVFLDNQQEAFFFYIEELVDQDLLYRDFIRPILALNLKELSDEMFVQNLPSNKTSLIYDSKKVVESIIAGNSVFVCDVLPAAVSCTVKDIEIRAIEEPITEKNVRGPHEGFIESLGVNLSILRRKIKNNKLKFKTITLGQQTNQQAAIAYIEGIANMEIVNALYTKISKIKIDGLPAIGFIEQSITSHPHSIFPQFLATERPDKAMAALLEGRIVVLQDGTPVVLIAPVNFFSFFQSLDDYSTLWIHGSFLRMLRFVALMVSILLPSLYIAITSFHYYAVPLNMLVPLAESRAKVPFPPIVEVLILEGTIELVREAAIRLPSYIGTAISVVAGLIIGQASVEAGLVSELLIVIVAATAVASYVIPVYDMALGIRILRFCFIVAASIFGIIGIVIISSMTVAHLLTIESLGQPFLQPIAPLNIKDLKDTLIRLPISLMGQRESTTRTKNEQRGNSNERKK